jgi:hypothetical protein
VAAFLPLCRGSFLFKKVYLKNGRRFPTPTAEWGSSQPFPFAQNAAASPSEVTSGVPPSNFHSFLSVLDGIAVELQHESIIGLFALCGAFGFTFAISLFRQSQISRVEAEVVQKETSEIETFRRSSPWTKANIRSLGQKCRCPRL